MPRYLMVALNGPTGGEVNEDAYNEWYDDIHIPDLREVTGVQWARRFKVVKSKNAQWPYVAAYEIECDDPDALIQELATKPRPLSPLLDTSQSAMVLAIEITKDD